MKHWQQSTQDELKKYVPDLEGEIERLQEQKQKVIALIKDGRFVEALQELENDRE